MTSDKHAVRIERCQSTMIPEEMHDKIIQDQMRNANDERRKSIKKEGTATDVGG